MALPHTPDSNPIDYIDDEDFIALEVPPEVSGERLDKFLGGALPDYSRLKTSRHAVDSVVFRQPSFLDEI